MSRVLVFSGGGDYADPWHPFAETSARVAEILAAAGHNDVTVVDSLAELEAELPDAEVLVVNAGGGPEPHPLDAELARILGAYDGPLVALHVAATLLPESDAWERMLGGRWVRGRSMHPPRGPLTVRAVSRHPIVDGLASSATVDEAYSWLRVAASSEVLLVHDLEGGAQPMCWIAESDGRRVAYDGLGHDLEAYEAPVAVTVLGRLVAWVAA
ncbi:hypothetical protein ASD56_02970 [Microbacterium sp. Root166]|uniref:ThuA domain-containing protein n=1 Tax=Microbacterium sp. Root166 TaxID=1736478 RepID=UPI0006F7C75B|nr:ThuA domain-containing protein [Microbacterium sp. Root166]KQZ85325.1 hypothetical protein ASD56_02970 [Microbacterium sp. Root166]